MEQARKVQKGYTDLQDKKFPLLRNFIFLQREMMKRIGNQRFLPPLRLPSLLESPEARVRPLMNCAYDQGVDINESLNRIIIAPLVFEASVFLKLDLKRQSEFPKEFAVTWRTSFEQHRGQLAGRGDGLLAKS